MNTSEALKIIYDVTCQKLGPKEGRKYVSSFFSNMMFDLEEAGCVTASEIEKKIIEEAEFCLRCSKKEVA